MNKLTSLFAYIQELQNDLIRAQMQDNREDFTQGIRPYATNILNYIHSCLNTIDFKNNQNAANADRFLDYVSKHLRNFSEMKNDYLSVHYSLRVSPVWSRSNSVRSEFIRYLQQMTDQFDFNYKQTLQNQIAETENNKTNSISMQMPQTNFIAKPVFTEEYFKWNITNFYQRKKHVFKSFMKNYNIFQWIVAILIATGVLFLLNFIFKSSGDGLPKVEIQQVYQRMTSEKLSDEEIIKMVEAVQRNSLDKDSHKQNTIKYENKKISFLGTKYSTSHCAYGLDVINNNYPNATVFINEMKVIQKPFYSSNDIGLINHPSENWCKDSSDNIFQVDFNPEEVYETFKKEISISEKLEYLKNASKFHKTISYNYGSIFRLAAKDKSKEYYNSLKNTPVWAEYIKHNEFSKGFIQEIEN